MNTFGENFIQQEKLPHLCKSFKERYAMIKIFFWYKFLTKLKLDIKSFKNLFSFLKQIIVIWKVKVLLNILFTSAPLENCLKENIIY